MSKKLWTELRSFAETTSVRGIPRVMKAKTRVTFVVWLVAVLTCAALLVWQLSVVLTRYFQYPVSTLTVQAPAWQRPTFPDITICNLDTNVYFDSLNFYPNNPVAQINQSFSYTMDDSPILPNIGYYTWFQSDLDTTSYEISAAFDPVFYKCFTIRPLTTEREDIAVFYAFLYVDQINDGPNNIHVDNYMYPSNTLAGLSVMVHPPDTAPNMNMAMYTVAGTYTNIQLTQSLRTRLGTPYSNCTDQQHLTGDNTSAVYTQPYCINTCIQQTIVDQCGCVGNGVAQYTMAQLRQANFSICEISVNAADATKCEKEAMALNISAACMAECVLPCTEIQYDAAMSLATWPSESWLSWFSYYFLLDPRFLYLLNIPENATEEEMYEATTTTAATELFKSRFLVLEVLFDSQSFIELKDVAAYSMDAMGAQIGGVLSLWLGVTVMFAFEAFEFLYIYLTNCRKKESTPAINASVAPAVENPRRSAARRSLRSLRSSSNRTLSGKLSASKRKTRVGQLQIQSQVDIAKRRSSFSIIHLPGQLLQEGTHAERPNIDRTFN